MSVLQSLFLINSSNLNDIVCLFLICPSQQLPSDGQYGSTQGSLYHSILLGMGGTYHFDRGPAQMVHRYASIYYVLVHSVWLGTVRYLSYRLLVSTLV